MSLDDALSTATGQPGLTRPEGATAALVLADGTTF